MQKFMEKIIHLKPNIFLGYTPQYESLYKNNFEMMKQQSEIGQFHKTENTNFERHPDRRDVWDNQYAEGNRIMGILGALGGSIVGVIIWVVVYQLGYISGIAGIAMFALTYGGYCKLGRKSDLFGIILSVILCIVMLFVAEMVSLVVVFYTEGSKYGVTIIDSMLAIPEALTMPDVFAEVMKDLIFGYIFMIIGTAGRVVSLIKETRRNSSEM